MKLGSKSNEELTNDDRGSNENQTDKQDSEPVSSLQEGSEK